MCLDEITAQYGTDEYFKQHREQVWKWVEEHVQNYSEPSQVTLDTFVVNNDKGSSFRVQLDDIELSDRLTFSIDNAGKISLYYPMFHSPLGAPYSYLAIDITKKTHNAILKGLNDTFNPSIDNGFNKKKQIINEQYSILVALKDLKE